jgi:hypothetical protein
MEDGNPITFKIDTDRRHRVGVSPVGNRWTCGPPATEIRIDMTKTTSIEDTLEAVRVALEDHQEAVEMWMYAGDCEADDENKNY